MDNHSKQVKVWEERVDIPTYGTGQPDKNPMFLEKRIYQGSSGRVYPHPVIDKIENDKNLVSYALAVLENEYVRIEIMPEIGGRIYRALDKTNHYDFVYYNRVIKPALVGLAGPWISGGIEFNWPQHHRPNTYGPVQHCSEQHEDGSATIWVSEIDRMYGTKVTTGFTLYPGKAYLEVSAQMYNSTPELQTFLWWANPAVAVNDHTQSVFPPDVHAVLDHGKRDVSRFPTATGTYYKMDYSAGVDISRYKNIPVPTSYMAYKSDYNFVGGYDHQLQAGLLHVANHHISPGKKQWTWGNGEFGQAWDRHLTDEDGPYIELMTGVYTDNQPDFTWLQPYEEKSFKQYFMPYKNIGVVKNASIDAAVNLEIDENTRTAAVNVYATSEINGASVELKSRTAVYLDKAVNLSPAKTFSATVQLAAKEQPHDLELSVRDAEGQLLISYRPKRPEIEQLPEAASPLPAPEELKTCEQLYLAGLHLEQYRHATFDPEIYYLEGLKRDPGDIRLNTAYGTLLLRRGLYKESETYFRKAVTSLCWRNGNPYDSEAFYQLGLALNGQGRTEEAFAAFYKAVWSAAWQDSGYFSLAQIACGRGDYAEALELAERALIRNGHNLKARNLKAAALRKLGRCKEALVFARDTVSIDVADFGARYEIYLSLAASGDGTQAEAELAGLRALMRDDIHNYLYLTAEYASAGLIEEAIQVLSLQAADDKAWVYPLAHYALGCLFDRSGDAGRAASHREAAGRMAADYCFPNTLFDLAVLEAAVRANPNDGMAHYYLGNLLYDKKRHREAVSHWERSRDLCPDFPTVHRNLALAYFNKLDNPQGALEMLEKAFACDPRDARVFYELDQLYKKLHRSPAERMDPLLKHRELVEARDDLYVEYVTLLNILEQHEQAIEALVRRNFHPWEGGEGKVTGQYKAAHVGLGRRYLSEKSYAKALEILESALVYPPQLGEGKLAGAQENDIYYYLGCAHEGLGNTEAAHSCYLQASTGLEEPASAMFYNDQPPEMIFYQGLARNKLHEASEASRRFNKLVDYAEKHLFDQVKIDYFAVSLPDFLVFEDNLQRGHEIHCFYMLGLGLLGLGKHAEATLRFQEVLKLDPHHTGALTHLNSCDLTTQ